jgi:hypothetical protein
MSSMFNWMSQSRSSALILVGGCLGVVAGESPGWSGTGQGMVQGRWNSVPTDGRCGEGARWGATRR